jgi:hypothetical protein
MFAHRVMPIRPYRNPTVASYGAVLLRGGFDSEKESVGPAARIRLTSVFSFEQICRFVRGTKFR